MIGNKLRFLSLQKSEQYTNGKRERHQSNKSCACGEEADQQMVVQAVGQGSGYDIQMVHELISTESRNTLENSSNTRN